MRINNTWSGIKFIKTIENDNRLILLSYQQCTYKIALFLVIVKDKLTECLKDEHFFHIFKLHLKTYLQLKYRVLQ